MKKNICVLLIVFLLLSLVGCFLQNDKNASNIPPNQNDEEEQTNNKKPIASSDIKFESTTGMIYWDIKENCDFFAIYANDKHLGDISSENAKSNLEGYYQYRENTLIGYKDVLKIKVTSYDQNYHQYKGAKSASYEKTLYYNGDFSIDNINLSDSYDFIEFNSEAKSYLVLQNAQLYLLNSNIYKFDMNNNTKTSIYVLPIYDGDFYGGYVEYVIEVLKTPNGLNYNSTTGNISWTKQSDVSYQLNIYDGNSKIEIITTETDYIYFPQTNDFKFEVKAISKKNINAIPSDFIGLNVKTEEYIENYYVFNNYFYWNLKPNLKADFVISIFKDNESIFEKKYLYSGQAYFLDLLSIEGASGNCTIKLDVYPNDCAISNDLINLEIYYPTTPNIETSYIEQADNFSTTITNLDINLKNLKIEVSHNNDVVYYEEIIPSNNSYTINDLIYNDEGEYNIKLIYQFIEKDNLICDKNQEITYIRNRIASPKIIRVDDNRIYLEIQSRPSYLKPYTHYYYFDDIMSGYVLYGSIGLIMPQEFLNSSSQSLNFKIYAEPNQAWELRSKWLYQTITKAPTPVIDIIDDSLIVTNFNNYSFKVIDTNYNITLAENITSNIWNIVIAPGEHSIGVYNEGDYDNFIIKSDCSNIINITKIKELDFEVNDGIISWTDLNQGLIDNLYYYEVSINQNLISLNVNYIDSRDYQYEQNLKISVRAAAINNKYIISSNLKIYDINFINPLSNLYVSNDNRNIYWDNINDKYGYTYVIKYYNSSYLFDYIEEATSLNYTNELDLIHFKYNITVEPNEYVSETEIGVYIDKKAQLDFYNEKINDIYTSNNMYIIDAFKSYSENIVGYVNDNEVFTTTSSNVMPDFSLLSPGSYEIKFIMDDGLDYDKLNTFKSKIFVLPLQIIEIDKPDGVEVSYNEGVYNLNTKVFDKQAYAKITSKTKANIEGVVYAFIVNGNEYELNQIQMSTNDYYNFNVVAGSYNFKVRLVGEVFVDNTYYLSSQDSNINSIYIRPYVENVTLLSQGPSGVNYNFSLITSLLSGYDKSTFAIYATIYINDVAYNNANPLQIYSNVSLDPLKGEVKQGDIIRIEFYTKSNSQAHLESSKSIYEFEAIF